MARRHMHWQSIYQTLNAQGLDLVCTIISACCNVCINSFAIVRVKHLYRAAARLWRLLPADMLLLYCSA
jgi:hypothetical protein